MASARKPTARTTKKTGTAKKATTKSSSTSRSTTTRKSAVTKQRTKIIPTEEQIRARAFEIYLTRNGGPGDAHTDWMQAERELIAQMSS
jgi:hypothetical protein